MEAGGYDSDDLLLESAGGIFLKIDDNNNGISGDHGFAIFKYNTHLLEVKQNGQVAIETNTPATGFKLSVDEKLASEEVKVELSGSSPDYVFRADYDLPTLEDVQQHPTKYGKGPKKKSNSLDAGKISAGHLLTTPCGG